MSYILEFSFNIRSHPYSDNVQKNIVSEATAHGCADCYVMHEIEGAKRIERNRCIVTVAFDSDNASDFINYLRSVRRFRGYVIESIYHDGSGLIYASKSYSSGMDQKKAIEFKSKFRNKMRNDLWTDIERNIIKTVKTI